MQISEWSADVCSSDLRETGWIQGRGIKFPVFMRRCVLLRREAAGTNALFWRTSGIFDHRSEEHTSELQSLMRISYAVFCLKKKNDNTTVALCHDEFT